MYVCIVYCDVSLTLMVFHLLTFRILEARKKRIAVFFEILSGTYDFYGLNHYTSRVVRKARKGEAIGAWPLEGSAELGIVLETRADWKPTTSWWFKVKYTKKAIL
jgi:hypothetical protein